MNDGWVKLHRKLLDNEVLKHDLSAYVVFTKLLLVTNRKTGRYITGRYMLSELTGLKPTTGYRALQRLAESKMVTLEPNNKNTVITICNWHSYQGAGDSKVVSKVTANAQQSDSKVTHNKKKNKELELTTTNVVEATPEEFGNSDINILVKAFEDQIGKMARMKQQRIAAKTLISRYTVERAVKAIEFYAQHARGMPYSPNIANLEDLRDRWVSLETFAGKEYKTKQRTMVHEI